MKSLFASVSLLVLYSVSAFGWGGPLTFPSISCQAVLSGGQKRKLEQIQDHMENELTFIEGMFINEYTQQQFGGSSAQVTRFIDLLKVAGVWEVEVTYREFGDEKVAFTTGQASSDLFRVTINSSREDFLLKDFARHLAQPLSRQMKIPRAEESGGDQSVTESEVRSQQSPAGVRLTK